MMESEKLVALLEESGQFLEYLLRKRGSIEIITSQL